MELNFLRVGDTLINLVYVEQVEFCDFNETNVVHLFLASGKQLTFSGEDAKKVKGILSSHN